MELLKSCSSHNRFESTAETDEFQSPKSLVVRSPLSNETSWRLVTEQCFMTNMSNPEASVPSMGSTSPQQNGHRPLLLRATTRPHQILRVGAAGAGRAGKVHIRLLELEKDVEVVAICTPDPAEQRWAQEVCPAAALYDSYDAFLEHQGMECIWLSTPTPLHKEHFAAALRHGLHIFCEKPLSGIPEDAREMYKDSLQHPLLKVACAFPRRYDEGYMAARRQIKRGAIGEILVARSQTTDRMDSSEFFIQYAERSGGVFVDSAIHDIDACLYLMSAAPPEPETNRTDGTNGDTGGDGLVPISAYGVGSTRVFPRLKEWGDADNALGTVEFAGGHIATFMCSRTNAHGHHSATEIIGTKGKIFINRDPRKLNIEISDINGTRMEAAEDHFELFEAAFVRENRAFLDWVLYDKTPEFSMKDAVNAVLIGHSLQRSLREKTKVDIDNIMV